MSTTIKVYLGEPGEVQKHLSKMGAPPLTIMDVMPHVGVANGVIQALYAVMERRKKDPAWRGTFHQVMDLFQGDDIPAYITRMASASGLDTIHVGTVRPELADFVGAENVFVVGDAGTGCAPITSHPAWSLTQSFGALELKMPPGRFWQLHGSAWLPTAEG